jgi:hypothetical protein
VEYAISTAHTFQQIVEALILALEDRGFALRQSFDLQSALGNQAEPGTNYCILMVKPACTSDSDQRTKILTIYQRKDQVILNLPLPSAAATKHQTAEPNAASLEAALVDLLVEQGWWSMEEVQT